VLPNSPPEINACPTDKPVLTAGRAINSVYQF